MINNSGKVKNLAICWNNSVSDSTRNSKNLFSGVNQQERFKSNFEYPQRLDARTLILREMI